MEAEITFFSFLPGFFRPVEIPEEANDKNILGVVEAPSVVAQRILQRNETGKTFWQSNRPLEFSVFMPKKFDEEENDHYWNGLLQRIQRSNYPTMWTFMPKEVIYYLFNSVFKGQGMFHAYVPTNTMPKHNFLLANGEKGLYSYHLSINQLMGGN